MNMAERRHGFVQCLQEARAETTGLRAMLYFTCETPQCSAQEVTILISEGGDRKRVQPVTRCPICGVELLWHELVER